jgi:hypothetical protein
MRSPQFHRSRCSPELLPQVETPTKVHGIGGQWLRHGSGRGHDCDSGDDESNPERGGGGTRDRWSRGYDAADPPETGASRILHWKTSACHLAGAGVEGIAGALPTSDPTGLSKVFRAVSHRAKPYLDIRPGGVTIAA